MDSKLYLYAEYLGLSANEDCSCSQERFQDVDVDQHAQEHDKKLRKDAERAVHTIQHRERDKNEYHRRWV